nr:cilia- and flagella-associated protein 157-like [Nerophis lumbriciformis]
MPKKKEKKQEDDRKKQSQVIPVQQEDPGDKEKNLYLLQIRFLNEELERQQLKCQRLEKEKTRLERRCVSLETEQKDTVEYLKMELLNKEDELERLTEKLDQSLREAQADQEVLKQQMEEEIREVREHVRRLEGDNASLTVRLMLVETFEKQKDQLMSDMAAVQKKLADREEAHADVLRAAEMKAQMEKSRLEKALEMAAADAASEVDRLVELKLPEASRRVALENREVTARYAQLSERALLLARENHALRQQRSRAAADVAVLEETVAKLARRSCVRKKAPTWCPQVAEQLEADLTERGNDLEQLRSQLDQSRTELEALRKSDAWTFGHLEAELHEARNRIGQLKEAVDALRPSLSDEDMLHWKQQVQKLLVSATCPAIDRSGLL